MKRTIVMAILSAAVSLAASSATAQSQAKVTIPFNFRVGSALMPAGTYLVDYPRPYVISFYNLAGHGNAQALATTATGDSVPPRKLVFNRYGNEYFLKETLTASGESEMTFAPTKLERSIRAEEARLQNEGQALVASK